MSEPRAYHVPVMLRETIAGLKVAPAGRYVDGTAGGGGHAAAILDKLGDEGRLILIDRDDDALERLDRRFGPDPRVILRKLDFGDLGEDATLQRTAPFDGILFDFGVSSHQIDDPARGFSFQGDGPLDMRMDRSRPLTAAHVVNGYGVAELARLLKQFGEEPRARRIAAELEKRRPLATTAELRNAVEEVVPEKDRIKTLSRVFQALRIEVNDELAAIDWALERSYSLLRVGGRLVTLAYHSLEDRRVKQFLRRMEGESRDRYLALPGDERQAKMKAVPRKAMGASDDEIRVNPRARSARLRIGEKVA